jgi:hypothetical protein
MVKLRTWKGMPKRKRAAVLKARRVLKKGAKRAYDRRRYKASPAKFKAYQKRYRSVPANFAKVQRRVRKYTDKNRVKIRSYRRRYWANRRATDIHYRLKKNVSRHISYAIRRCLKQKRPRTLVLIGCDIHFLMGFLEARFKPGMTWRNYGDWHIDHVIPCAEFDLAEPDQLRQCFHYSNLQPLWGPQNQQKGAKLPAAHQAELI